MPLSPSAQGSRPSPLWLRARLGLVAVAAWERLGQPERARRWLERWCRRPGASPLLLEALALRCCDSGARESAVALLVRLWQEHGRSHLLYRLLFRRRFRTAHGDDPAALLERIAVAEALPAHFRAYGAIALAYRTLEAQDSERMAAAITPIAAIAAELEADPETPRCRRADRENRAKLLVSCYTVLSRLQVQVGSFAAFSEVARRAAALSEALDLGQIDPDVGYRIVSNLLRCLGTAWLEAWLRRDAAALERVTARIEAVARHAQDPRHGAVRVREDHAGFAREVSDALQGLALEDRRLEPLQPLIGLVFKKKVEGHDFRTHLLPALERFRQEAEEAPSPEAIPPRPAFRPAPANASGSESQPLRVLYITSRGHSGSTLLDLLLSGHSAITSVGEIKMLPAADSSRKLCSCHGLDPQECPWWRQVQDHLVQSTGLRFEDLQLESVDPWVNHRHNLALYESVAAVSGCRTIVDSSKNLPRLQDLLQGVELYGGYEVLPIHLLRGPLGVVHSYVRKSKVRSPEELAELCYNYIKSCSKADELLHQRPHLLVRYERLAARPRQELMRLMEVIGLPFEEAQMDWGRGPRRNLNGNEMRFRAGGPIRPDRSWMRGLTLSQKLRVLWFTLPGWLRLSRRRLTSRRLMKYWRLHYKPALQRPPIAGGEDTP
ncbi:MAG: sulfotransferase [Prochlorococcaceae cyanobacterium]